MPRRGGGELDGGVARHVSAYLWRARRNFAEQLAAVVNYSVLYYAGYLLVETTFKGDLPTP
jgi:hypothetical protein